MKKAETIKIMGIDVDKVTKAEALAIFSELIESEGCSQIITLNPEMIIEAQTNEEFRELLKRAELRFPDGIGLVYASKIIREPLSERVTGIDFARSALEMIAQRDMSAYFFGAKPGIAELAAENIAKEIPGLKVAGARDGYFKPEEEDAIIDEINASGAELLLLGLGAPKQEMFVDRYKDRLGCRVAVGIGGSFDVWSGTLKRAPEFFIDHNVEWLYRLLQEPSRINRISKLPFFLVRVAGYKEK